MNEEEAKVTEEVKKVIISVTSDTSNRNSTGKANTKSSPSLLSSRDEKFLPHYLRSSTSSCHDFCKYGKSHAFEPKKRLPIRRSFPLSNAFREKEKIPEVSRRSETRAKSISQPKDEVQEKESCEGIIASLENTNFDEDEEIYEGSISTRIEELSEASEITIPESSSPTDEKGIISHEPIIMPIAWPEISSDGSESVELYPPSPKNPEMARADEPVISKETAQKSVNAASAKVMSSINKEEKSSEKKAARTKLETPSPNNKSVSASATFKKLKAVERKKSELNKVKKTSPLLKSEVSERAKVIKENKFEPKTASVKPKITEQKNLSPLKKIAASVSPVVTKKKAPLTPKGNNTASISSKQRTPLVKSTPTNISSRRPSSQRNSGSKLGESPLMNSRSLKPSSPAGIKPKVSKSDNANEKVREKTLYVIGPKTPKTTPNPAINELKKNRTSPSSKASTSEAKLPSPHKLKFRRGKVVSLKPENNSPRKLLFRQANGASEGKEATKRSFRMRKVSIGSAKELMPSSLKAPAVILKHQDVQEKETQGLFNEVIEETASKLVETRKSKVKALVGAFETVISLQEQRVVPSF